MFTFTKYSYDVWAIARKQGVPVDVAFDKFRADVQLGYSEEYNSNYKDIDFAPLKQQWDALTEEQQSDAREEWHDYVSRYYKGLCAASHDRAKHEQVEKNYRSILAKEASGEETKKGAPGSYTGD